MKEGFNGNLKDIILHMIKNDTDCCEVTNTVGDVSVTVEVTITKITSGDEVVYNATEEDEAKEMEIKLIAEYGSNNADRGYNCTIGGDGVCKYHTDEERKLAVRASGARTRARIKADPAKYQQRLEQMREFKKQYYEDPVMHEKLLAANQRCHLAKRSTPEGRAEDNAATYKIKYEVKQIRNELRDLYEQYPELFTEEDYHFIFDRRQTPNKSWVFVYNSKTTLYNILVRAKEALDGKTDN